MPPAAPHFSCMSCIPLAVHLPPDMLCEWESSVTGVVRARLPAGIAYQLDRDPDREPQMWLLFEAAPLHSGSARPLRVYVLVLCSPLGALRPFWSFSGLPFASGYNGSMCIALPCFLSLVSGYFMSNSNLRLEVELRRYASFSSKNKLSLFLLIVVGHRS